MRMKRLVSLLLAVILVASTAIMSVGAVTTDEAGTGAFYNQGKYSSQTYDGDDLGATYTPTATTWKVWSPAATAVQLKLYKTGTDRENGAGVIGTYDLSKDASFSTNGLWKITLQGDYKNVYYTYMVTAADTSGTVVTNETQDIYSQAVGANGDRSMVVDLDSTDPEGWEDDQHVLFDDMTQTYVWEIHIRDFSCDPESGISAENQGNYLAFTEGGTTLQSDLSDESISTGIDYLVEQGINCVQLMPFADYDQVDEIAGDSSTRRNWGYNPKNYNVPDGAYSSNPYDGNVRITEVKKMVQALHDRGISVIMDVVYNHTAGYEASCFTKTVPGYYYRMSSSVAYVDGSGQGCELASENAMVRNYIVQSLLYWVEEYHIDGFRFDLMACIDCDTLNKARAEINKLFTGADKIPMYGEPWAGGTTACTNPATELNIAALNSGVGVFSAEMRDAATTIEAKTNVSGSSWVEGNTGSTGTVVAGILANNVSSDNTQTVNYAECHDNYALWDKITGASTSKGEGKATTSSAPNADSTDEVYLDRLQLAGALFATSQGITFMQLGTEFARTKQGQFNSYNSSDEINQLDWSRLVNYDSVVQYYRGLNKIHDVYSAFSDDTGAIESKYNWISNSGSLIAYTINNSASGEWGKVAVLLNNASSSQTVSLGESGWVVVANGTKAGVAALETISGSSATVEARSAMILVDDASYIDFSSNYTYGTLTTNHYVNGQLEKTTTAKYQVGDKYHALKDEELLVSNNVTSTTGAASGTFTGDTTVNYYYESNGKDMGTLTVQYVDLNGRKVTPDMEYTLENGDEYNIPVCSVEGYQLNTDAYPENTTGTFDGDKTIVFNYKPLDSSTVTIHYYNTRSNWSKVLCYAYTEDGEEPLGAWNASARNTQAMMTSEGNNWFTIEVPIASCKVMFYTTTSSGGQEPGQNEPGYAVAGECWVQNKVVTYNATQVVSCINIETGKKVKEDTVTTEQRKSTETYSTTAPVVDGATLVASPANAAGFYQPGVTNIVYLYTGGTAIDEPTTKYTLPEGKLILGDANFDGYVNVMDVTYIQQNIVHLVIFSEEETFAADVDGNGKVNIKDASYIQRYLVNMNVSYSIGYMFNIEDLRPTEAPDNVEVTQTVLFTNNYSWQGTIYCYYWTDEAGEAATWPGVEMTYIGTNDYGEPQWSIDIPVGCNFIITNNSYQTEDLVFSGETGFYISGDSDGDGQYDCGSW